MSQYFFQTVTCGVRNNMVIAFQYSSYANRTAWQSDIKTWYITFIWSKQEKLPSDHLQHQHVLCSSAAAAGCWMLWVSLRQRHWQYDHTTLTVHCCWTDSLFNLFSSTGVKCEQLTQPASVTVQSGQQLTITCQVSYSVSGYWTAWIRHPAGKVMEWIGYALDGSTSEYKDSLKNKFSINAASSSNTVTLNGQNMQPEDTAVYYCARDPQ